MKALRTLLLALVVPSFAMAADSPTLMLLGPNVQTGVFGAVVNEAGHVAAVLRDGGFSDSVVFQDGFGTAPNPVLIPGTPLGGGSYSGIVEKWALAPIANSSLVLLNARVQSGGNPRNDLIVIDDFGNARRTLAGNNAAFAEAGGFTFVAPAAREFQLARRGLAAPEFLISAFLSSEDAMEAARLVVYTTETGTARLSMGLIEGSVPDNETISTFGRTIQWQPDLLRGDAMRLLFPLGGDSGFASFLVTPPANGMPGNSHLLNLRQELGSGGLFFRLGSGAPIQMELSERLVTSPMGDSHALSIQRLSEGANVLSLTPRKPDELLPACNDGDLTGDGKVDLADMEEFAICFNPLVSCENADLNGNRVKDFADFGVLAGCFADEINSGVAILVQGNPVPGMDGYEAEAIRAVRSSPRGVAVIAARAKSASNPGIDVVYIADEAGLRPILRTGPDGDDFGQGFIASIGSSVASADELGISNVNDRGQFAVTVRLANGRGAVYRFQGRVPLEPVGDVNSIIARLIGATNSTTGMDINRDDRIDAGDVRAF